jgi:hypothetical protein
MIGATAGGTTLNGEGLQHQDRHSLLMAQTNPAVEAYDPSFAYELAVLVEHGLERMFTDRHVVGGEDVIFYLTVYNEPVVQPAMPEHVTDAGHRRALPVPRWRTALESVADGTRAQAHVLSSGTIIGEALRAQELLAADWDIAVDVWSAPGWNRLLREGTAVEAFNRTNPSSEPRVPMVTRILEEGRGRPFVAVSDWMRATPFQIADFVPGTVRGTGDRWLRTLRHTRGAACVSTASDAHVRRLLRPGRAREARRARPEGARRSDREVRARLQPRRVLRPAGWGGRRHPLRPTSVRTRVRVKGGQGRDRTADTTIFSRVLYQLSYLTASGPDGI